MKNSKTSLLATLRSDVLKNPVFTTGTTLLLAIVYTTFLYKHLISIRAAEIDATTILFVLMETLVLALLFLRKKPTDKSTDVLGWVVAGAGTFLPLLLVPSDTYALHTHLGQLLMLIGSSLAVLAYLSLNTSFGVSPSLREVKTTGLYTYLRHPMYFSYFVLYIGYILLVFSPYNLLVVLCLFSLLILRTYYEEKILLTDESYAVYKTKVKYRIIPFVY